jgi:hypothetical protein
MENEIELIFGMLKELLHPQQSWKEIWKDKHIRDNNNYNWYFRVYFNKEKNLAIIEMEEFRREYYVTLKKEVYFVSEYTEAILLGQKLFPIWIEELENV